jgi:hypothetical protein
MLLKRSILVVAAATAVCLVSLPSSAYPLTYPQAFASPVKEGDVVTATRVLDTVVNHFPYITQTTTKVVWTVGPSVSASSTAA